MNADGDSWDSFPGCNTALGQVSPRVPPTVNMSEVDIPERHFSPCNFQGASAAPEWAVPGGPAADVSANAAHVSSSLRARARAR